MKTTKRTRLTLTDIDRHILRNALEAEIGALYQAITDDEGLGLDVAELKQELARAKILRRRVE